MQIECYSDIIHMEIRNNLREKIGDYLVNGPEDIAYRNVKYPVWFSQRELLGYLETKIQSSYANTSDNT